MTSILAATRVERAHALGERLEEQSLGVRHVSTAAAALDLLETESFALLVMESALPDLGGNELLRRVRRSRRVRDVPVIVVSDRVDEIDRVIAFELGADDFVGDGVTARELALRIRAVLRRVRVQERGPVSADRIRLGLLEIDVPKHRVSVDGHRVRLTVLEFRLLQDLATRLGRVQRREELLERVWQSPGELETRTVDTHVKRLREKLGPAGAFIETVRGVGYRMRESLSAAS